MCVHGYVGVKNINQSVTFIHGYFDTNNLGLWLHCNITNAVKIKNLLNHQTVITENIFEQLGFDNSEHVKVVENVDLFSSEALSACENVYLWDNKRWLEKTHDTEWHEIG